MLCDTLVGFESNIECGAIENIDGTHSIAGSTH
jgi:hypothetical protein